MRWAQGTSDFRRSVQTTRYTTHDGRQVRQVTIVEGDHVVAEGSASAPPSVKYVEIEVKL